MAGQLREQWQDRAEGAIKRRIHRASVPEREWLETFPWTRQAGVNRKQVRTFAELDFVGKHENLLLGERPDVG